MGEIRTMLLHLDALPLSAARLDPVARLATELEARIDVLYAVLPFALQSPFTLDATGQLAEQMARCQADARDAARAAFERECARAGLAGVHWHESGDEPVRAFRERAWAADLLVLAQPDPASAAAAGVRADFVPSVLLETGKPGLVMPYVDTAPGFGRNVLVAWKATPESARALTAALPILQRARSVHVACWDEGGAGAAPALAYLQRHGVGATAHHGGPPPHALGEQLLSLAADLQADLLVMGCYGHGRAREWVLGGVSRTILQSMTLPTLMVH